jgi:hypothetical protein
VEDGACFERRRGYIKEFVGWCRKKYDSEVRSSSEGSVWKGKYCRGLNM